MQNCLPLALLFDIYVEPLTVENRGVGAHGGYRLVGYGILCTDNGFFFRGRHGRALKLGGFFNFFCFLSHASPLLRISYPFSADEVANSRNCHDNQEQ